MTTQPADRDRAEQLTRDGAEAESRADRGEHLRQPLLVDLDPVRGGEPEHEPDLVQRQDREVGAGDEDRDPENPVPARERLDQRSLQSGSRSTGTRAARPVPASPSRAATAAAISSTGKPSPGGT